MMQMTKTKSLSEAELRGYRKSGVHFPVPVLTSTEAAACRRKLEDFEEQFGGGPLPNKYRYKLHLMLPWLDELIRHPHILDAVEDVIGPDLLAWNSTFFIKEARDASFVGWHQDMAYWGLVPPESVTAWVAFTDSTVENGAMRMIPGTFEPLAHQDTFAKLNMLSRGQEIAVAIDKDKAVDVTLRAGEVALFDARLAHGSEPNMSRDRRIGFAIRYIPTHVRQVSDSGVARRSQSDVAVLVRGQDVHKNFTLAPRPRFDMDPEAVALHQQNT